MRRTAWLAVIVLGFALAAGIGCGKKQAAPQSGPVTTSTSEQSAALPTGTENPTATVPEGTPQQAPGAATATTPQAGAQGRASASTAVSKGPAAPAAATVQVTLTRDYMDKYLVYYPKVSEATRQAAGQKGEGGPTSFEAMRQQMEPKVTQALQGSRLTAETYWALSSRIRLAMRKLRQDEGGGGAAGRGQGAGGTAAAGGPGGGTGATGKGGEQMTAEQRQRMEQRRQEMEKEMASLTPAELALAKEYRDKIQALQEKYGGGFGGDARGGAGAGGSPRAGGGRTGT